MISIALCTYNGEKYIEEQLNTLIHQTCPPNEIIISDDHSTDHTVEIVKRILEPTNIDYKININKPNLGVFKNFEKAISLCSHEYIFCCDQDDIWKENKIEKFMEVFEKHPTASLVFSNAAVIMNDINHYLYPLWDPRVIEDKKKGTGSLHTLVYLGGSIAGCCMAFKKSFVNKIYPFPDQIYHDDYLATCASLIGEIQVINEELIYYRQHGNNVVGITRGSKLSYWKSLFTNVRPYIEHREYIYGRHQLMVKGLFNNELIDTDTKVNLLNNLEFTKHRASIRKQPLFKSVKEATWDWMSGKYYTYAKGNYEYFKDIYDILVVKIFNVK